MFGSFLPSLWSSSNQSVLRSREPTLLCNQVLLKSSMWITSGWPWTRAQPSNEQQLECAGLEKDRETGRCLTNGISLDCARSGDYFDHLDESTGCTLISSALRGP